MIIFISVSYKKSSFSYWVTYKCISDEAAGEILNSSILGVKGLLFVRCSLSLYFKPSNVLNNKSLQESRPLHDDNSESFDQKTHSGRISVTAVVPVKKFTISYGIIKLRHGNDGMKIDGRASHRPLVLDSA